jgi:serine/threonine protein kinase
MTKNENNENVINNKYIIETNIGKGQFGSIYKGYHKKTREPIAIKFEHSNSPIKLLKNETTILNYLFNSGSRNIPQVHWYGLFSHNTCLVMTLYDYSLYDLLKNKKKDLSIQQLQYIMLQSLDILENIHNSFILHRDIKPQNFMIKNNELFLIDFGFSTFYIGDDKNHLPMKNRDKDTDNDTKEQLNIIGTPKYISLNIHNGITPSRRDDLISLGYIYIYLLKRELHWDNLPQLENNDNYQDIHILHPKNQYIKSMKQIECIEKILDNDNNKLYQSILYYIKYCYSLNYDDEPNYYSIKQLFMKMI